MIEIWTDGCCLSNPGGVGGWAWVAVRDGKVIARGHGGAPKTSNNKMEMTAAIEGLRAILREHPGEPIKVRSDSRYVVSGAEIWIHAWKRNGWMRKARNGGRRDVANVKLWKEIDTLREGHKVEFEWVKGHDGHRFNEMCDHKAGEAARELEPDVF